MGVGYITVAARNSSIILASIASERDAKFPPMPPSLYSSRRPSVAWNLSKDGSVSGRRETFGKNKEQVDFRKMVSPCTRNGLTVAELSVPFFFSFLFCGFKVSCVNIIGIFECDSRWFKFLRLDERDKLILKEISCFSYVSYIFFHRSKLLK